METVAGICVATVVSYQGYQFLRRHVKTKVNCWFCNENTRVDYNLRNCFVCPSCEQYNGFDSSGDYNKRVPGQHNPFVKTSDYRFCSTPLSRNSDKSRAGNGLCDDCNTRQAIIMRKVADFEPTREDKWEEELEDYKYRLNKMFALCTDCTLHTHAKLQNDKIQYNYLLTMRDKFLPGVTSVYNGMVGVARQTIRRHRRKFFAGGRRTEFAHLTAFMASALLFIAHLNYLQEDAEVCLLPLPDIMRYVLPRIVSSAFQLSLFAFVLHIIALYTNKCRANFTDVIFPIFGGMHALSFAFSETDYKADLALCRCAIAAFMTILATAVTFLPRKKLHKRKPNRIITSAFSVASTPASQCSSRNASSMCDSFVNEKENVSPGASPRTPAVASRLQWRERQQSPEPEIVKPNGFRKKILGQPERERDDQDMDWEPSVVGTVHSSIRPSERARMLAGREATPSRELAPSLSGLSLNKPIRSPARTSSVFSVRQPPMSSMSSIGRPHSAFPEFSHDVAPSSSLRLRTPAPSQFGRPTPSISGMTSVSRRSPPSIFGQDSPTRPDHSVFTSVSQQQMELSLGVGWKLAIVFITMSALFGWIAVLYLIFQKKQD